MMKIFFDTNFIIDYFVRPQYREECEELLKKAVLKNYDFYISFLSAANFAYIIRKYPIEIRTEYLKKLEILFEILSNNKEQFIEATKKEEKDFEDVLQYLTAKDNKCDVIITRNQKDFQFSKIPILSTTEFINMYLS